MTRIDAAQAGVQQATELPAVLDASYAAFDAILSVLHPAQDPASDLFTAFVLAAASAANGRNAVALAPSLPRYPLHTAAAQEQPGPGVRPERVAGIVAGLSHLVAERLTQAAACAPDPADRDACSHAAQSARYIRGFLTGTP